MSVGRFLSGGEGERDATEREVLRSVPLRAGHHVVEKFLDVEVVG